VCTDVALKADPARVSVGHSNQLVELSSGVDSLILSGRAAPSSDLLGRVTEAQAEARTLGQSVPFRFGGADFFVTARSFGRMYPLCLESSAGQIGLRPFGNIPAVRVQPRAELLHAVGPAATVELFDSAVRDEVGYVDWSVNRIDLFADWQGLRVDADQLGRFACRGTQNVTRHSGELCTGFQFGNRNSKSFSARLYDKTEELKTSGADWLWSEWGELYREGAPVHRVEFEIRVAGLKSFALKSPGETLEGVSDLWHYCTHEWLSLRTEVADKTKSRWPVDPAWVQIQQSSLRHDELGLARIREGKTAGSLRKLMPLLNGCLVSYAVLVDEDTLEGAIAALPRHVNEYSEVSGVEFDHRVANRRADWQGR